MVKERIEDLVDILGEEYAKIENSFVIRNNEQLMKYLDNPQKWKDKQLASRLGYRKDLIAIARSQVAQLNAKAERVFLLSYQEVAKDNVKIVGKEIIAEKIPEDVKKRIKEIKEFNASQVVALANQTLSEFTRNVRVVSQLSTPETLYETIKKQFAKGIENGIKVVYKDKKVFSWKAYMEMNVRTTVNQEISNQQASSDAIFFMCDSFADSAPDHADYQGKIYYNENANIPEEVRKYIESHQIQSIQSVKDNPPYLTTRPNCRHTFSVIPTDEVIQMSEKDIAKKYDLDHGEYKGSNYEASQKQRYNERQIRKWKLREENLKLVQKETGFEQKELISKASSKVRAWQKENRELIKEHKDILHRQYDRENARIMVDSLGVNYDYKVVNGELVKK